MKYTCSECGKTKKEKDFDLIEEGYCRCVGCSEETAFAFWNAGVDSAESNPYDSHISTRLSQLELIVEKLEEEIVTERQEKRRLKKELSNAKTQLKGWRLRAEKAEAMIAGDNYDGFNSDVVLGEAIEQRDQYKALFEASIKGNSEPIEEERKIANRKNKLWVDELKVIVQSDRESRKQGYVYLVRSVHGLYKIGRSKKVEKRMDTFAVKLPFPISLSHSFPCRDMRDAEKFLHDKFADKRLDGEWFNLDLEDIAWIKSIESDEQLYGE